MHYSLANLIICANSLANATFLVANKHTCDQRVDASINTIKYLNGPHGGVIGPHMSH